MTSSLSEAPGLSEQQIAEFDEQGHYVVRKMFTNNELKQITDAVYRVVDTAYTTTGTAHTPTGKSYPEPATLYQLIGNFVSEPELSWLACHPRILRSVQSKQLEPIIKGR